MTESRTGDQGIPDDNVRESSGIEFSALGSGSSGNACLVRSQGTAILVDAGISCRQVVSRLQSLGQDPRELDAILLTHEHRDHTKALPVFCGKFPAIPVLASSHTRRVVGEGLHSAVGWQIVPRGGTFLLGGLEVCTFPVPHDAVEPVGFVFRSGSTKFGIVTDAGHITETMRRHLLGARGLYLETNYDSGLLEADPHRPWSVKQRIMGPHGHLSNDQAAEFVGELVEAGLEYLVCGHLSDRCNTPERVSSAVGEAVSQKKGGLSLLISGQNKPTPLLRIPEVK